MGVFLLVFLDKSAGLFHTSSVPVIDAQRTAGSVHKSLSSCQGGGRYWLSLPLRKKEKHRENATTIYKGEKRS